MLLQQVRVLVMDGQQAAFERGLIEVRRRAFLCAGFRGFTVAQDVEDPCGYVAEVRWETLDELTDVVRSGRFERCWAPVQPFLQRAPQVDHLVERPGLAFPGPGSDADLDLAWLSAGPTP